MKLWISFLIFLDISAQMIKTKVLFSFLTLRFITLDVVKASSKMIWLEPIRLNLVIVFMLSARMNVGLILLCMEIRFTILVLKFVLQLEMQESWILVWNFGSKLFKDNHVTLVMKLAIFKLEKVQGIITFQLPLLMLSLEIIYLMKDQLLITNKIRMRKINGQK